MQVEVPPIPPVIVTTQGPPPAPWEALPPPFVALIALAAIIAAAAVLVPLVRAFARRIEGRTPDADVMVEVRTLRERVAALEESQGVVAELEERLDFAERMLTRQPAQRELQRPAGGP